MFKMEGLTTFGDKARSFLQAWELAFVRVRQGAKLAFDTALLMYRQRQGQHIARVTMVRIQAVRMKAASVKDAMIHDLDHPLGGTIQRLLFVLP